MLSKMDEEKTSLSSYMSLIIIRQERQHVSRQGKKRDGYYMAKFYINFHLLPTITQASILQRA
jgi:hypothetical protein